MITPPNSSNNPPLLPSPEILDKIEAAIDPLKPVDQEDIDKCVKAIFTYSTPELELQFPECLGVGIRERFLHCSCFP